MCQEKKGGRGSANIKDSVNASVRGLEKNITMKNTLQRHVTALKTLGQAEQ